MIQDHFEPLGKISGKQAGEGPCNRKTTPRYQVTPIKLQLKTALKSLTSRSSQVTVFQPSRS